MTHHLMEDREEHEDGECAYAVAQEQRSTVGTTGTATESVHRELSGKSIVGTKGLCGGCVIDGQICPA
jgi:hypothetical protein